MNIYDAAEYLVNAISRNPDFRVTYDGLKMQVQQYNQAIAAFFDTETKYNFIFSKFPEIFIFKNDMISLTDAYLSVYRHEKPSKSFSSCGLPPDMENCAILYFLKILNLHGPQQYLNLFNMLMNDGTEMCADYFRNYSDPDMFNFFASYKEYFILSSDIVTATPSILSALYRKENNAKGKLNECVSFLLKCFGSFHYFELSKCICYGANCCKTFLKQFSFLKQREHFENLPDVAMDKYGFLSLKNKKEYTSFPLKHKMKLLTVCILAFKKKLHFQDLINEAIVKSKQSALFFHRMPKKNQLMFFKKLIYYFKVSEDGFVKLLPSFTLPKCLFEDSTSDDIKQVTPELKNVKVNAQNESVISYLNDSTSNEEHKEKKIKVEMNVVSSVPPELNKIKNNSSNETLFSHQSDITSDKEPKKEKIKVETDISSVHPELNKMKIQNNSPNETLTNYRSDITLDEEPYQSDITSDEEPYQSDITSDEEPKKRKIKVETNISSIHPELNKIQNNSNKTLVSYQNDITSNEEPKKKKMKVEKNISSVHPELNKIQNNSNETLISYQDDITSDKKSKKRKKSKHDALNMQVCFVLKCFKSMHYFELRECISYADNKIKCFLNEFSGGELRKYFEGIPNTDMDQYGFLRLKNEFVTIPLTNDHNERKMMIVLTVCILAFKKKMHFKDLINEAIEKSNQGCNFPQSTERQLQFFKNNRSIFVVSSDGFVQLLPTFMLRKCSFEELSTAFKQNVRTVPLESLLASKNLTAKSVTKNNDGACGKVQSYPQHDFDLSKNDSCISTADQNSVSSKKPSSRSWFNAISF